MGINWEKMQELSKQKQACTRATACKAKLNWELEKVTSFYFCRQLTLGAAYSGIRSIPQVEIPNNFLSLILIDNVPVELTQLEPVQTPNPPPLWICGQWWAGFPQLPWDEQHCSHPQGADRGEHPVVLTWRTKVLSARALCRNSGPAEQTLQVTGWISWGIKLNKVF